MIFRYLLSGSIIASLDFILFIIFYEISNDLFFSFSVNYAINIFLSYFIHGKVTFLSATYSKKNFLFFVFFFISSYFIGLLIIQNVNNFFGNIYISKLLQIVLCAIYNILGYKFFVFKNYNEF